METKPLLYGLIGFFIGGLLVAIAANTFDKKELQNATTKTSMTASLEGKQGDDYDKAFLAAMLEHHEGAVAMAQLSASQGKHNEIKQLSNDIIVAQQAEITKMQQWQRDWGYNTATIDHSSMKH